MAWTDECILTKLMQQNLSSSVLSCQVAVKSCILCSLPTWIHTPTSLSISLSALQGKPVEILPFLYLGSAYHASRQDYLCDLHITALLNVSRRDLQPTKGHYDYKWIPVEDSHMADISSHFQEAIEFIGELKGMALNSLLSDWIWNLKRDGVRKMEFSQPVCQWGK